MYGKRVMLKFAVSRQIIPSIIHKYNDFQIHSPAISMQVPKIAVQEHSDAENIIMTSMAYR